MVDELQDRTLPGAVGTDQRCLMCEDRVPLAGTTCSRDCYVLLYRYIRFNKKLPESWADPLPPEYHPWYAQEQERVDEYAEEHALPEEWLEYLT